MTPAELTSLTSFRDGERFLNGTLVDWGTISYKTMYYLDILRARLDSPIALIRGAHPHRAEAVDATCPGKRLAEAYLELTRLPVSFGIYSGHSFHIDTRPYERVPARWLAVKVEERSYLSGRGLSLLVYDEKDGWLYLSYSHPRSFEALILVCELADRRMAAV